MCDYDLNDVNLGVDNYDWELPDTSNNIWEIKIGYMCKQKKISFRLRFLFSDCGIGLRSDWLLKKLYWAVMILVKNMLREWTIMKE